MRYSAQCNMDERLRPKDLIAITALSLLSEEPRHPYQLQRLMRDRHKDYAVGRTRALYRAIEELEAAGSIEPIETSREGRRPERTVYRITDEGREELQNWLADLLVTPATEHPVFSVAIGLLAYLPQERAHAALTARVVALRAGLAGQGETARALLEEIGLPRVVLLDLEHLRVVREAELRWVMALLDDLDTGRLAWNKELLVAQFAAMSEASERRRLHVHQQPSTPLARSRTGPTAPRETA